MRHFVVGVVCLGAVVAEAPRACRKIPAWCEVDIQPLLTKGVSLNSKTLSIPDSSPDKRSYRH
jgi:hypothetical protein